MVTRSLSQWREIPSDAKDLFSLRKYNANVEKALYTLLYGRECLQDDKNSLCVLITESQSCRVRRDFKRSWSPTPLQSRLSTVGLDGLLV